MECRRKDGFEEKVKEVINDEFEKEILDDEIKTMMVKSDWENMIDRISGIATEESEQRVDDVIDFAKEKLPEIIEKKFADKLSSMDLEEEDQEKLKEKLEEAISDAMRSFDEEVFRERQHERL